MAKQYLGIFLASILCGCLLVMGVTVLVDPYGLFDIAALEGFNQQKTQMAARDDQRTMKSVHLVSKDFDAIIFGSSRVERGLNPSSDLFGQLHTYNSGLRGVNIYEICKVIEFALQHQNPKIAILGLDFYAFSTHDKVKADYKDSLFSGRSMIPVFFERTLSLSALRASIETISDNLKNLEAKFNTLGMRNLQGLEDHIDHRRSFSRVLLQDFFVDGYACFEYDPERVALLKTGLNGLVAKGVRTYLAILPIHARQVEAIRVMGLYPLFEQWKRDLVKIVDHVNREQSGRGMIQLWDFSGYSEVNTEKVPLEGEKHRMKYYFESSHFNQKAGDLMLANMLGSSKVLREIPSGFGVLIDSRNIEEHLANIRKQGLRYRLRYPDEIIEVKELKRMSSRQRRLFCRTKRKHKINHQVSVWDRQ